MPQATPAGKACGPCAAAKAACSLTGRAIGGSQSQADPESFRRILDEAVGSELQRLRGTIKRHTRILRELTLGTRAQILTGHMVKTLRSQSTFDSNMPSDQMLSTF